MTVTRFSLSRTATNVDLRDKYRVTGRYRSNKLRENPWPS